MDFRERIAKEYMELAHDQSVEVKAHRVQAPEIKKIDDSKPFALYHHWYDSNSTTMIYVGNDKAEAFDHLMHFLREGNVLSGEIQLWVNGSPQK